MGVCKALQIFFNLCKKTILREHSRTEGDQKQLYVLQTRALFCHCCVTLVRTLQVFFSSGAWFQDKKLCSDNIALDGEEHEKDCVGNYNSDLMDPPEYNLRMLLKTLVFVGIIIDLLSFKWRRLANAFIYLECFTRIVASLIPNFASYEYTDIEYVYLFFLIFVTTYCDEGRPTACAGI